MNFLEKYNNKKNIRFPFFKKAINIALERDLKVSVPVLHSASQQCQSH